jgi:hypothetical protein
MAGFGVAFRTVAACVAHLQITLREVGRPFACSGLLAKAKTAPVAFGIHQSDSFSTFEQLSPDSMVRNSGQQVTLIAVIGLTIFAIMKAGSNLNSSSRGTARKSRRLLSGRHYRKSFILASLDDVRPASIVKSGSRLIFIRLEQNERFSEKNVRYRTEQISKPPKSHEQNFS